MFLHKSTARGQYDLLNTIATDALEKLKKEKQESRLTLVLLS